MARLPAWAGAGRHGKAGHGKGDDPSLGRQAAHRSGALIEPHAQPRPELLDVEAEPYQDRDAEDDDHDEGLGPHLDSSLGGGVCLATGLPFLRRAVLKQEDLVHGFPELPGQPEDQCQGRIVPRVLDRVNGLPRDADRPGQVFLGEAGAGPEFSREGRAVRDAGGPRKLSSTIRLWLLLPEYRLRDPAHAASGPMGGPIMETAVLTQIVRTLAIQATSGCPSRQA
jgi:hypothetical protein